MRSLRPYLSILLTLMLIFTLFGCQKAEPALYESTDPVKAVGSALDKLKAVRSYSYVTETGNAGRVEFYCERPDKFMLKYRESGIEKEYLKLESGSFKKEDGAWQKVADDRDIKDRFEIFDLGNTAMWPLTYTRFLNKAQENNTSAFVYSSISSVPWEHIEKIWISEETGLPLKIERTRVSIVSGGRPLPTGYVERIVFDYNKKVDLKAPI